MKPNQAFAGRQVSVWRRYGLVVIACLLVTLLTAPFRDTLQLANAVMLFLLVVFLVALKLGRGPAVFAAFLSVALFDFFLVPPHFTFAVSDGVYLITFAVMLAVGLLTTGLTTSLQDETERVRRHERETREHYELARTLTGAASIEQVEAAVASYAAHQQCRVRCFWLTPERQLDTSHSELVESHLLQMAFSSQQPVRGDAEAGPPPLYLPLRAPMGMRGVLAIYPEHMDGQDFLQREPRFITLASLLAIAVERLHYVDVARQTEIAISAEKLRSSLLAALSHDLRTPLTSLLGMADALAARPLPEAEREAARLIRDQAGAVHKMMTNLLDMARLQAGKLPLRREWQLYEEVISTSLQLLRPTLAAHPLTLELAPDLPLVRFDAVLIERVLCNLLENAAKYAPAGSPIRIRAYTEGDAACLAVCDAGPGIDPAQLERLFALFERGDAESGKPGMGLGLGIAKAIAEAHGGSLTLSATPGAGTTACLRLPLGTPPSMVTEDEHEPG
ncbi:DUF4118 domain-containing protein [Vogesella sp. GCM10023246]|uniref:histidine kinase n=1 Tax=Vogesella oryzagri TaxID=3160864 RepID=A0ABV1M1F2_9NEIS